MSLSSNIESFLKGNNLENKVCETGEDDCKHTEVDHNIEVSSKEKQSKSKQVQGPESGFFLFRHLLTSSDHGAVSKRHGRLSLTVPA